MKVKYEFDCNFESDDRSELKVFQLSEKMFEALTDISDMMRGIRKGWDEKLTIDQLEEKISDIIYGSRIGEIE